MSSTRRAPALAAILLVLAGAALIDSRVDRPARQVSTEIQVPMGARTNARSSAFFCAGATAAADGAANGSIIVANAGERSLSGTVTVIPSEGEAKQVELAVPANGRAVVQLTDVVTAPYASAVVELDGGQAVAEMSASGALGQTITPCASRASTRWFFAEGVTTRDALEVLTLFNPFPEDAVVDLVFTTEEGEVTPQALTGLSVRGRGMVAINVGEHVQRREAVSARITARVGRLVASRLQTFDGSGGREGMAVALGAAASGDVWYFPEGLITEGLTERFQVFNPGTNEARAQVELALEQGTAEPIVMTIPGESRVTLAANEEARIPKNVPHSVTVRSTNGVGIVVERTIDATSPSGRSGLAITLGARVTAERWLVAAGQVDEANEEWIVVQNPSDRPSRVSISVLDGSTRVTPTGLDRIDVSARQRKALKLSDTLGPGPASLLVTASEPVVVERDVYRLGGAGTAMAPAVPLRL